MENVYMYIFFLILVIGTAGTIGAYLYTRKHPSGRSHAETHGH